MLRSFVLLLASCYCYGTLAGCTSASEDPDGGSSGDLDAAEATVDAPGALPDSANPLGTHLSLTLPPFDVEPNSERQVCVIYNLPTEVPLDVVRFHSTMEGTSHHFNFYKVLGNTTAVTAGESDVHDCTPAQAQVSGDAALIFGSGLPEMAVDTPLGVAFHLLPKQRLVLEQHVINTTDDTIKGGVTVSLFSPKEGTVIEHYADLIWFANWLFYLFPGEESSATQHCTVPYDVELFGLSSHTHSLGTHFAIEKWTSKGTAHLYDSADWLHPLRKGYSPTLSLAKGEGLEWTCTWFNSTKSAVGPGQNSTDEMCITFAAAYPREGLEGAPIQCNKGLTP
jgi:hypothetical protein